jgi:hypothetical protein
MKAAWVIGCCLTAWAFGVATTSIRQDVPEPSATTKEHELLKRFVGSWESNSTTVAGPGQAAIKCRAKLNGRMLGGLWVVTESTNDMGGMKIEAVQTIGYDPEKKKYVGTWVDSVMNHLWRYEGSVDLKTKALTLEADGPHFSEKGKTSRYREIYDFKSDEVIAVESQVRADDGRWTTFMNGEIRRAK